MSAGSEGASPTGQGPWDSAGEVEITPEMIKAGVLELYAYENDPKFCSEEEIVSRIFRAMVNARQTARVDPSDPTEQA